MDWVNLHLSDTVIMISSYIFVLSYRVTSMDEIWLPNFLHEIFSFSTLTGLRLGHGTALSLSLSLSLLRWTGIRGAVPGRPDSASVSPRSFLVVARHSHGCGDGGGDDAINLGTLWFPYAREQSTYWFNGSILILVQFLTVPFHIIAQLESVGS